MNKSIFALVLVVVLTTLSFTTAVWSDQTEDKFERAEKYYNQKKYVEAIPVYISVVEGEPGGSYASFSALRIGMCHFLLSEYRDSAAALEKMTEGYPDSRYLDDASYLGARAYFEMGDTTMAMRKLLYVAGYGESNTYYRRSAKGIADLYENSMTPDDMRLALADYYRNRATGELLYLLAIHERKAEDYERCIVILEELNDNYEGTEYYEKARDLLVEVREALGRRADVVGLLVPLSGDYSIFGKRIKYAVQLAFENYNKTYPDKQIQLLIEDSGGDPSTAVTAARTLVYSERCIAIIGPCLTNEVVEVAKITVPAEVPIISPTISTSEIYKLGDYVFQNGITYQLEADAIADYAMNGMNVKNFAILYPNNNYGKEHSDAFRESVEARGGTIKSVIEYPTIDMTREPDRREVNYSPYTRQIKSAKALGLYIPGHGTEIVRLLPQLTFSDVNSFYFGSNGWNENTVIRMSGKYIEGSYFTAAFYEDSRNEQTRTFIAQYRKKVGEIPKYLAAQAYDAALLTLKALDKNPTVGKEMMEAMSEIKNFDGVSGKTTLRGPDGKLQKDIVVLTVHEGEIIEADK